jgi:hypothetical protein
MERIDFFSLKGMEKWKEIILKNKINLNIVKRQDGSIIENWLTFKHNDVNYFSWIDNDGDRAFSIGNPPFIGLKNDNPTGIYTTNLVDIINNPQRYINGTKEHKENIDAILGDLKKK